MERFTHILTGLLFSLAVPSLALAAEAGADHAYSLKTDLPFWGLVAFIGFVWAVRKLGWQSFVDGLTERERKENEAIAEAENKNLAAQQALTDQKGLLEAIGETRREYLEEAERDAQRTRSDIVASAVSEAETIKNRAVKEVERTRNQLLKQLFDTMASRVIERTEQQLRATLSEADQQRLMDESLAEFTAGSQ